MASYGVPYMGSKNLIAEALMEQLPPAEVFVDLFAGGCAMTHVAMVSGKYKRFIANDLDFRGPTLFRDAIAGKYHNEKRVITRDAFKRLKDTDPCVALCWSFGQDGRTYLCAADKEQVMLEASRLVLCEDAEERRSIWMRLMGELARMGGAEGHGRFWELRALERLARLCALERLARLRALERLARLHALERLALSVAPYDGVDIPGSSVVYCDPPYAGKKEYTMKGFDHERFYDWLRTRDFPVWVSEYSMPGDFKRIWSRRKQVTLCSKNNRAFADEGLWLHEKWLGKVYVPDLFGLDEKKEEDNAEEGDRTGV